MKKAGYYTMRQNLDINWKEYLSEEDIEGKWIKLIYKQQETTDECVSKRVVGEDKMIRVQNKNIPMNKTLQKTNSNGGYLKAVKFYSLWWWVIKPSIESDGEGPHNLLT